MIYVAGMSFTIRCLKVYLIFNSEIDTQLVDYKFKIIYISEAHSGTYTLEASVGQYLVDTRRLLLYDYASCISPPFENITQSKNN